MSIAHDPAVGLLADALQVRGGELIAVDSDSFPMAWQASFRCDNAAEQVAVQSQSGDRVTFADLSAVWVRRLKVAAQLPQALDDRYRSSVHQESQAMVLGLLATYRGKVLDPYPAIHAAGSKPRQLQMARDLGLDIPRTLVTNDPEAVRAFAAECPGPLVTKTLSVLSVTGDDAEYSVFTSTIDQEDMQNLHQLQLCPMVFQECITKQLEIRATIVGRKVFAAAVDSQASERGCVDWRRAGAELDRSWRKHTLPTQIADRLIALVQSLGLTYSAADLILTPEGRYIFLESNPAGEWLWIDGLLNLGIAESLADELLS